MSKKIYAWKPKHIRKKRSRSSTFLYVNKKPWRKQSAARRRAVVRETLHHVLRGNLEVEIPRERRHVLWDIW